MKGYQMDKILIDDIDKDLLITYKWYVTKLGYAITYKGIYLHRLVGERINLISNKKFYIDHINRNKLDNRRLNLRLVSPSMNLINSGLRKDNTSKVRGVCWDKSKKKWYARVEYKGEIIWWGRFNNLEEAKIQRDKFKICVI